MSDITPHSMKWVFQPTMEKWGSDSCLLAGRERSLRWEPEGENSWVQIKRWWQGFCREDRAKPTIRAAETGAQIHIAFMCFWYYAVTYHFTTITSPTKHIKTVYWMYGTSEHIIGPYAIFDLCQYLELLGRSISTNRAYPHQPTQMSDSAPPLLWLKLLTLNQIFAVWLNEIW